jgi:hypothetical protein
MPVTVARLKMVSVDEFNKSQMNFMKIYRAVFDLSQAGRQTNMEKLKGVFLQLLYEST